MTAFSIKRKLIKFKGLLIFLFLYLASTLMVLVSVKMISNINIDILKNFSSDMLYIQLLQYLFMFLIIILFFRQRKTIDFISDENWFGSLGKAFVPAIFAFASGLFVTYMLVYIVNILPFPEFIKHWMAVSNQGFIEILEQIKKENQVKIFIWFTLIVVIGPVFEEILFRGFLQNTFEKIFKKRDIDVYLTAFIFGIFHFTSLSNIIYAFIIGYFLSRQRKLTGSVNSCFFIHGLINFTGLVAGILTYYLQSKTI
jgi:membrane protease YdiL (CAAX protease family)